MLQRDKAPLVFEHEGGTAAAELSSDVVADAIALLRRQHMVIAIVLLLTFCAAGVYLLAAPANYTATATLLIDTRKNQLFQQQSVVGDIPVDTASVESQVQILRSETIALAVIKDFRLTESPEFTGPNGVVSSLVAGIANLISAS